MLIEEVMPWQLIATIVWPNLEGGEQSFIKVPRLIQVVLAKKPHLIDLS